MRLLAVMLALHRPAAGEHGATAGEAMRQVADRGGRHVTDRRRPFRRLRRVVCLAEQIRQEAVEAGGVVLEELLVVQLLGVQRVGDAEHQRDIGLRPRCDPLGTEIRTGLGTHRIDADHLLAGRLERGKAVICAMIGDAVADLIGGDRVCTPDHQQLGVLCDNWPNGLLLVYLERANNVRHDDLRRAGRIIAGAVHEAALQVHHAAQQCLAVVQAPGTHPAIGAGKRAGGAIFLFDALQFGDHEVERLVPGDADKITAATAGDIRTRALFEECAAHHWILDARRRVD